jgi:hypothetical protein
MTVQHALLVAINSILQESKKALDANDYALAAGLLKAAVKVAKELENVR